MYWTGGAAVFVFFVLSGFVLSLPFLRATPKSWRSYYPARLVRLYLPVWGAVALATVIIIVVPRDAQPGQSSWVSAHDGPFDLSTVLGDLTLVGTSFNNSALWSLKYEVTFSLLLPLYLLVAGRLQNVLPAIAAALAALVICGAGAASFNSWMIYMPMFAMGVLMAVHRLRLLAIAGRTPSWAWAVIWAVALPLLWMPIAGIHRPPSVLVGASLAVFIGLGCPVVIRVAETRVVQMLGTLSFSLYLVHEPIVVTLTYLWPTFQGVGLLVLALPLSLAVAWAFFRLVESPAHGLSKAIGRASAGTSKSS